jgi:hypothetical protein
MKRVLTREQLKGISWRSLSNGKRLKSQDKLGLLGASHHGCNRKEGVHQQKRQAMKTCPSFLTIEYRITF